jgi:hypothetical protein
MTETPYTENDTDEIMLTPHHMPFVMKPKRWSTISCDAQGRSQLPIVADLYNISGVHIIVQPMHIFPCIVTEVACLAHA